MRGQRVSRMMYKGGYKEDIVGFHHHVDRWTDVDVADELMLEHVRSCKTTTNVQYMAPRKRLTRLLLLLTT